jgi:diguanylate cyclase (GGDEF)-like protein
MQKDPFTTPPLVLVLCKALLHIRFFKDVFSNDYDLLETQSTSSFLELLRNVQVDYIIIDERVVDSSLEVISKEIKAITRDRYIPIIIMTRNLKKSYETQLKSIGISGIIREPLEKKEILTVLGSQNQKTMIQNKVKGLSALISPLNSSVTLELKHRLAFNNKASEQLKKIVQEKQTITLLMIELDDYPSLILQNGEAISPPILKAAQELLEAQRRPQDVLISLGGAKWILILPKTSKQVGIMLAEDIRLAIQKHPFTVYEEPIKLSASIGLTEQNINSTQEEKSLQQLNRSISLATGYAIKARLTDSHIVTE